MCDAIHTPRQVDGLPILVELAQYPDTLDGVAGDRLAVLLSEVASETLAPAAKTTHGQLLELDTLLTELRMRVHEARAATAAERDRHIAGARAAAIRLSATALAAAAFLTVRADWDRLGGRQPAMSLDTEVLRWLRQTIGELLGRVGEAAVATCNPRAHVGRMLSACAVDAVQRAITSRWGCEIVIGQSDTVAAVAAAIVAALHRQSHSAQETRHAQG